MNNERITILAELNSFTGYGLQLIEWFRWLTKLNYFVTLRPLRIRTDFGTTIPLDLSARVVWTPQCEEWEILLSPPSMIPTAGKKTVYYTMWESTVLPEERVAAINKATVAMVPSRWCRETFMRSGVTVPIYVVPLGIDSSIFRPTPFKEGPTVFATAGRTAHGRDRKGMDSVIRSFIAAFPYDEDVRLQIKCHPDCDLPPINDGRIIVTREHLAAEDVAAWLGDAHCFVSGAAAEAWGLWQHQSMACARPVICAPFGGLTEFIGDANSYPVSYRMSNSSEHFGGQWAVPDLGDVVEAMRGVHKNRDEAKRLGQVAAISVAGLTWKNSVQELLSVLGQVGAVAPFRSISFRPHLNHAPRNVESRKSIVEQCAENHWPAQVINFEQWPDEAVFNPSIIRPGIWCARSAVRKWNARTESKIITFRAAPSVSLVERGTINLPHDPGVWIEDPRGMTVDGQTVISFTAVDSRCAGIPSQQLAFIDRWDQVVDLWHVDFGNNGAGPSLATSAEKNWIWFKHGDDWHIIYWLEPMTVVRVVDRRVSEVFKTSSRHPDWRYGSKHGGAHPVRIGDEYFGFCHSLMPWFGRSYSRYFLSAYAFEAKPPFAMTRLARGPFLGSDDVYDPSCSCVICGGAVIQDGVWTLAVGARDEQCIRIRIPHSDILATMDKL